MTKPVEEMNAEEIAEARAEIARQRAALNSMPDSELAKAVADLPEAGYSVPPEHDPVEELRKLATVPDITQPEPWPHEHLEFQGMALEVRKPGEAALVAISLTGSPSLTADVQMRIFSKFLENHMSPKTFAEVIEAMLNPDSEINLQGLIKALAEMPR